MKKRNLICGAVCLTLAGSMVLSSCGKKDKTRDSETTPLVVSSEALDSVFNPYFYTTGPDGNVVGQTQIGMLSTDKDGNLVCGENEPCVVLDYTTHTVGTQQDYEQSGSYEKYYTDYWFAIKNGIKFSDGSDLTIKDVLFNLYVLLDPTYTGSSTLYSVNIQGLAAYRAQSYDESEQEGFDRFYEQEAELRIDYITQWCDDDDTTMDDLTALDESIAATDGYSILEYISKAKELFKEELNTDWTTAASSVEDSEYKKYGFDQTWQIYLAMEGLITFSTEDDVKDTPAAVQWNDYDKLTDYSQSALVQLVYDYYIGDDLGIETYKTNLKSITSGGWLTATNLLNFVKGRAIEEALGGEKKVSSISGIQALYDQTTIGEGQDKKTLDGSYDVLKIRVNGVDPKAIYNFSLTIAPMYYYSTQEEIQKFDPAAGNFGVAFASSDFFERMRKIQVPVGAGPYKASNSETNVGDSVPDKSDFFDGSIVYFERNPYFETVGKGISNVKIKKLRYKVVASTQLFDAVTGNSQEVQFATPTARQTYIASLEDEKLKDDFSYALASTLGYGYIGVNAGEVKELEIRQAIMYAIDPTLCLDYYQDPQLASIIYRPMTSNSWAYPDGCTPYYPYDATGKKSQELANQAGYSLNPSTGKLTNSKGETLKFTFTIAGDTEDHPAYAAMQNAADILNKIGFDITVTKDANALRKLTSGGLQVWAAAWSSTIDPDMYQVYHKDSKATSTLNWGYDDILDEENADIYYREIEMVEELSDKIDEARETLDRDVRTSIYSECLDLVMALAVEFPTYQRNDLFIWNTNFIDSSTLAEATAYQSPLSRIWEVDFVK